MSFSVSSSTDAWGVVNAMRDRVHREAERVVRPDVKLVTLGVGDLFWRSNYQNFQRYIDAELSIAGDAQATLPSLIEAVKVVMPPATSTRLAEREKKWRAAHAARRAGVLDAARYGWNESPVSTARLAMETWSVIRRPRLGPRLGIILQLAVRLVANGPSLPTHRRLGRCRRRLRRSVGGRCGAGASRCGSRVRQLPAGRRPHVRARCALDRSASSNSAIVRDAQQPGVPSGAHAPATHGRASPARSRWKRAGRQHARGSVHRFRDGG